MVIFSWEDSSLPDFEGPLNHRIRYLIFPSGSVEPLKAFEHRGNMIRMIFYIYCSNKYGQELGGDC